MTQPFRLHAKQDAANKLLTGPQRHTLLAGGARSGKTFVLTRATVVRALRAAESRHAILRFRGNAVWSSIGLDTLPKVMRLCFPQVRITPHKQDKYFTLPNGSEIWLGGLDDKDRVEKILGQEYATIYLNECSQIPYASVLVALTRLAQQVPGLKQRAYYDLNPTGLGHWSNRLFGEAREPVSGQPIADPDNYRRMFINPEDNAENLSPEFLASLRSLPEKQRRRFYDGLYVAEVDGALWTLELIDRCRLPVGDDGKPKEPLPLLTRIVVAVDPSGASGPEDKRSDEIGIVVVGLGVDGRAYVLADRSCREGPSEWGKRVAAAYKEFAADRVIAEQNFGGEMVRFVIRTADPNMPVDVISGSRGKHVRADPVAALYEQDKVRHVGRFPALEEQMCAFSTAGYTGEKSPDRADALVWGLTELMVDTAHSGWGLLEFYRQQAAAKAASDEPNPRGWSAPDGAAPADEACGGVRLRSNGASNVCGHNGRSYLVGADGTLVVHPDDVTPLTAIGFTRA